MTAKPKRKKNAIGKVLVIKLSAVGDFVLAVPAFERIRAAHPARQDHAAHHRAVRGAGAIQPVLRPSRQPTGGPTARTAGWRSSRACAAPATIVVYDLQNSGRTNLYFQALRPFPPAWSGAAAGCSLPHRNPDRDEDARARTPGRATPGRRHLARRPDPAAVGGAARHLLGPRPDTGGAADQRAQPQAGGTAHPRQFGQAAGQALAHGPLWLAGPAPDQDEGFDIVIIGALQESELAHAIQRRAPRARDLTGRTDFAQIASLGAKAALAVGNDTGPVHLIAAAGAPTIALFSSASDPALSAPRGHVTVFQAPDLKDVTVDQVFNAAIGLAARPT